MTSISSGGSLNLNVTIEGSGPPGRTPVKGVDYLTDADIEELARKAAELVPGGDGTSDYQDLENKPSIGGVELSGDKTAEELGLQPAGDYLKDDDISDWAKHPQKPAYTPEEIGAQPKGEYLTTEDRQGIIDEVLEQIPESGVSDYNELENKPRINGVELSGDKTAQDLGLQPEGDYANASDIPEKLPAPYTLTFVGAVNAVYDGSEDVVVTIPTIEGPPGVSPTVSTEEIDGGTRVVFTFKGGTETVDLLNGKTPIKGADYFTEEEKQEIAQQAAALVPVKSSFGMELIGVLTLEEESSGAKIDRDTNGNQFELSEAIGSVFIPATKFEGNFYWYFAPSTQNFTTFRVSGNGVSNTSVMITQVRESAQFFCLTENAGTTKNGLGTRANLEPAHITEFRFANFDGVKLPAGTVLKLVGRRI